MSDELAPGDIAALSQSGELAFRAQFDGVAPGNAQLYWRALVMDDFDGRRWRAGVFSDVPMSVARSGRLQHQAAKSRSMVIDYRIFMEPNYQRWLYALETPEAVDAKTELTWDYRLLSRDIVFEKFSYRARAVPDAPRDEELSRTLRERTLRLPAVGNPQTRQWAEQMRRNQVDDAAIIAAVLQH